MASSHTDDLRLAHVLADDADSLTLERFRATDLHVSTKPDTTPVTDADRACESLIRGTLSRARPRDAQREGHHEERDFQNLQSYFSLQP